MNICSQFVPFVFYSWNDTKIFLYIIFGESEALALPNCTYFFVAQGKRHKVHGEGKAQLDRSRLYNFEKKCLNLRIRKPVF